MELRDQKGKPIRPGARVKSGGEEGVVRHVEPGYGLLTMVIEERNAKKERMVRASTVEVLDAA